MNKRLVFTITSGRSGTMYLTHLLSGVPGVISLHEPVPLFKSILPAARGEPQLARDFLLKVKLPDIEAMPGSIYVESSHYFGKGFIDPMLELKIPFDVVLLRRQPRKIASSWFLIGGNMNNLLHGKLAQHIIGPNEPNFLPANAWRHWNDYQLVYWYALETHFRAKYYSKRISEHGGRIFETYLKPLASSQNYQRLLEWLELPQDIIALRTNDIKLRTQVVNDKSGTKRDKARENDLNAMNLDALEAEVHRDCGLPESVEELLRGPIHLC